MKTPSHSSAPADARPTRRQLQAMETKDRIYNAAVREINEKGFAAVSIEDITRSAHVAKGSFYTHFESKEALVLYTFQQSDKIYAQAYEAVRELAFLPAVTGFVRRSYQEYEKRGKGIIKAIITNYFTLEGYPFYSADRPLLQCLRRIVESGKREGALAQEPPAERYVDLLLAAMAGVEVMWCFDAQGRSLADMMEDAVRVTARGMMA